MELGISQALVRYSVSNLQPVMAELEVLPAQQLLAGYNLRIADGNHLGATEHRLKVLHNNLSRPLPGQSIAVLDPEQMLVVDVFLNEDGHAQERSLLPSVLETVKSNPNHGVGKIEAGLSDYYLVEEVQATFRGMAIPKGTRSVIALPAPLWTPLHQMNASEFAQTLKQWAKKFNLKRFSSSPRGRKKPKPKPTYDPKHPHVSTSRLLRSKTHKNQYKRLP